MRLVNDMLIEATDSKASALTTIVNYFPKLNTQSITQLLVKVNEQTVSIIRFLFL